MTRADPTDESRRQRGYQPTIRADGTLASTRGRQLTKPHIKELHWHSDYAGQLEFGDQSADVRVEAGDRLHFEWTAAATESSTVDLLPVMDHLAGNTRFTCRRGALGVCADTMLDGSYHLPLTLEDIRDSFALAVAQFNGDITVAVASSDGGATVAADSVSELLASLPEESIEVVSTGEEWELRLRTGDKVLPLRLAIEAGGVTVTHGVIQNVDTLSATTLAAVADHVLRLNARLIGARLQQRDTELVAIARLNARQLNEYWLQYAARAVANAVRLAADSTRLLAERPEIAATYRRVFTCSK